MQYKDTALNPFTSTQPASDQPRQQASPRAAGQPAPATPAAPGPVLELRGAAVRVGGSVLWSGVDLTVGRGEFVAVLGPNGAGKSTLLKVLLGLLPTAAGQVRVLGQQPGRASHQIGYLPQRRSFDASARIRGTDVVRLGLDGDRWGLPLPFGPRSREGRAAGQRRHRPGRRHQLRRPPGRRVLRRRAAAPPARPGPDPPPGPAAPRRAPGQPRPAQPGHRRGPDQPHLP